MMAPPGIDVAIHIDVFTRRPWLGVKVGDLASRRRAPGYTVTIAKCDTGDLPNVRFSGAPRGKKLLQSYLAFAKNNYVRPCIQIFVNIRPGHGPADDRFPADLLCFANDRNDFRPSHKICIEAEH